MWLAEQQRAAAVGPMLLIHSPQDDWVQGAQAQQMFDAVGGNNGSAQWRNRLDLTGECVHGEHPAVLTGESAKTLAACIADFAKGVW